MPVRMLVTGEPQTPAIDATLELIGREKVLARLESAL
jgi:glutamyl-tRNA synthetase